MIKPGTIIKDEDLEEYLKDKLTERPFYGFDTESVRLSTTDWAERQRKQAEERKAANIRIARGLK